jgi:hypothetical protein
VNPDNPDGPNAPDEPAWSSPEIRSELSPTNLKLIATGAEIMEAPPDRADFLHSVMCQVGMPRKRTPSRTFERHSGHVSILLEAGKLWNGREWVNQPLPYGTTPRLVMVHVSSEAVRTQNRSVEIGHSVRQFLTRLGMQTSGGARGGYTTLRRQMEALAACRLMLGMQTHGKVVTVDAKPIKRFEAWLTPNHHDGLQHTLWPGVMELSEDFFNTLTAHAVPLDYRALAALKHSSLALDIYTWLAHRLRRVKSPTGTRLSWENLRSQFGQEYRSNKDFKKQFRHALRQVLVVYPDARVEEVIGGLLIRESRAPLGPTFVGLSLPRP